MEATSYSSRLQNTYRRRQNPVKRPLQVFFRNGRLQSKAGDLGQRMHSSIGASRALRERRFARNLSQRRLQLALDGELPGLHLPAAEIGAVVGQGDSPRLRLRHGLVQVSHFCPFSQKVTPEQRSLKRRLRVVYTQLSACYYGQASASGIDPHAQDKLAGTKPGLKT